MASYADKTVAVSFWSAAFQPRFGFFFDALAKKESGVETPHSKWKNDRRTLGQALPVYPFLPPVKCLPYLWPPHRAAPR